MTTITEPTLAELDGQLVQLDAAHAGLLARHEGVETELAALRAEWTERAALGDVDEDLTARVKAAETSLASLAEAVGLNRQRHAQVAAQRAELITAQQLVEARERHAAEVAVFAQRIDAETIIARLLDTVYGALRATTAELRDLHADQERLDAESANLGVLAPARKQDLPWGPGLLEKTPMQVWRAVLGLGGWVAEEQVVNAVSEYVRDRVFVTRRDNPNEPVPTWEQVIGG